MWDCKPRSCLHFAFKHSLHFLNGNLYKFYEPRQRDTFWLVPRRPSRRRVYFYTKYMYIVEPITQEQTNLFEANSGEKAASEIGFFLFFQIAF